MVDRVNAQAAKVDGRTVVGVKNRARLLAAAVEVFAQRGYRGTTTKDVAAAAGITERTLFRHVSSKAELFRIAVIEPVEGFLREFRDDWAAQPRARRDAETETREFLERLVDMLDDQRAVMQAFIAAMGVDDIEEIGDLRQSFIAVIDSLAEIFAVEVELRGWDVDPAIAVRCVLAMALSMSVQRTWLFSEGSAPDKSRMVDQLTSMTTWGLVGRSGRE